MATRSDVRRISLSFSGVEEGTDRFRLLGAEQGKVQGFAWVWLERLEPQKPRVPNAKVLAVSLAATRVPELTLLLESASRCQAPKDLLEQATMPPRPRRAR